MNDKKEVGELFRKKLDGKTVSPKNSKLIWDAIENELNNSKKRKKTTTLYISILGLCLIIFSLSYYNYRTLPQTIIIKSKTNDSVHNVILQTIDSSLLKNTITDIKTIEEETLANTKNIVTTLSTLKLNKKNEDLSIKNEAILNYKTREKIAPSNKVISKIELHSEKESNVDKTKSIQKKQNRLENHSLSKTTKKQKDSIINKQQKWIVIPFIRGSFFGNSDFLFNYGVLVDYKIYNKTNIRFGIASLDLHFFNTKNNLVTLKYFELPIEFRQIIFKNKFETSIIAGGSYLYLNKVDLTSNNTINQTTFNKGTPTLNLGININHHIGNNFHLNIETKANYLINTENNSPSTIYSFMLGIGYEF